MAVMKANEFVERVKDVAQNYKTLYVMGCFGAPLTGGNVSRYCSNHEYNKATDRTAMIRDAADQSPPVFGFDCVNLIKGILWGWTGNPAKIYGGAIYKANGVPDMNANNMFSVCKGISTDFSKIEVGEAVWCSGHIGVYIGGGLAVECTPRWKNNVQITAIANIGKKAGYNARTWTKHGKLPYVEYDSDEPSIPTNEGTITTGSVVRVKEGAKTYAGGRLAAFGYSRDHTVKDISGDRAVITFDGVVVAAVKLADLTLAGIHVPQITEGSTVRLREGAKAYTGGRLASFVYSRDHTVKEISGDRAVITFDGAVVAAVKLADLTLA